jgi:hypothetical protein
MEQLTPLYLLHQFWLTAIKQLKINLKAGDYLKQNLLKNFQNNV